MSGVVAYAPLVGDSPGTGKFLLRHAPLTVQVRAGAGPEATSAALPVREEARQARTGAGHRGVHRQGARRDGLCGQRVGRRRTVRPGSAVAVGVRRRLAGGDLGSAAWSLARGDERADCRGRCFLWAGCGERPGAPGQEDDARTGGIWVRIRGPGWPHARPIRAPGSSPWPRCSAGIPTRCWPV